MDEQVRQRLRQEVAGKVSFNVPLAPLTSFNIGGPADCLIVPAHPEDLKKVLELLGEYHISPVVIGNGTNLLVTDKGVRGVVIRLGEGFKKNELLERGKETVLVSGGAAVHLESLITFSISRELAGIESLSGIPGSLGGALRMNAGAFGSEIKDAVQELTYMLPDGTVHSRLRDDLAFCYRHLHLPPGAIIHKALLKLRHETRPVLQQRRDEILSQRKKYYLPKYPSAGSIFKNPPGHSAGRLIEEAGLKGLRTGGAQISPEHGNFFINAGGATAQDVIDLMDRAVQKVRDLTGITLEPEIRIVGEA